MSRSLRLARGRRLAGVAMAGVLVAAVSAAAAPAAGAARASGVAAGPAAEAWGFGGSGELGDGAVGNATHPVAVRGLSGVRQISAGAHHSLALLSGGTVMAWGQDNFGQLGDGKTAEFSNVPVRVAGLSGVTQVSAGDGHSLALLSDGTVMAWGENAFGQLGIGTVSRGSAVPVPVSGLTGVKAVLAGNRDSFAVLSDGTVMAWGEDTQGQLGNGQCCRNFDAPVALRGLSNVTALAAGGAHTMALVQSGHVFTWGYGLDGENGNGQNQTTNSPGQVPGLSNVTAISATHDADFAVLGNGTVQGWGGNIAGELGHGGRGTSPVPVALSGLSGVASVTSGNTFSLARTKGGTLLGWGDNSFGELAGGTTTNVTPSPVAIPNVSGVTSVSAGGMHALVLTTAPSAGPPAGPAGYRFGVTPIPVGLAAQFSSAVSAASASDAWAVIGIPGKADEGAHWNGKTWTVTSFAAPANAGAGFAGIYDAGPGDAWAVGNTFLASGQEQTLIEHWNGSGWAIVPSPNPAGGVGGMDVLQGVNGSGPKDIWAIGYDFENTSGGNIQILLAHFNGTTWTAVPTPTPGGGDQFGTAVSDASPTDAWAVGYDDTNLSEGNLIVAFHWDGSTWHQVPVPNAGEPNASNTPSGVTIASPADVWVSAYDTPRTGVLTVPFLLHYNGTSFSRVAVPSPGGPEFDFNDNGTFLHGITSLGPSDIYAVGLATYNGAVQGAFVDHFNGTSWSVLPVPQPGDRGALGAVPGDFLLAASAAPGGKPGAGAVFLAGAQASPLELFGNIPLALVTTKG